MSNRGDENAKLEFARQRLREQYRTRQAMNTRQLERFFVGLGVVAALLGLAILAALLMGCRSGSRGGDGSGGSLARPPIDQPSGPSAPPVPPANDDTQLRRGLATPWRAQDLAVEAAGKTAPRPRRRPSEQPVRIIDPLGRPQPLTWTFDANSSPARTPEHMLPWKLCVSWADKADDNQYSCSGESGAGEVVSLQVMIPGRVYDRPWAIAGVYRWYEARVLENGIEIARWRGMIVQQVARGGVEVVP